MTTLYLVQHGLACSSDVDASRPLTAPGQEQVIQVAETLQLRQIKLNNIFHSGKLRAKQTAEIFQRSLNLPVVEQLAGMGPNDDVEIFSQQLTQDGAMYVGHLPHLDRLASLLLAGDAEASCVHFQNAGVVCIERTRSGQSILSKFSNSSA